MNRSSALAKPGAPLAATMKRQGVWLLGVLALTLLSACGGSDAGTDPRLGYAPPDPADYRSQTDWVAAFDAAHQKLSTEYALTAWKGIDWSSLYQRHINAIRLAATTRSAQSYFVALHQYLFDIDDGHVSTPTTASNATLINSVIQQQSGGSYGLGLAELDDASVVAASVAPDGPAARAGIQAGAHILQWNGRDPGVAIGAIHLGSLAAATHMATHEHQRLEQVRLLNRAPLNTGVEILYRNPGSATEQSVHLDTVDDALQNLSLFDFAAAPNMADEAAIVQSRTRDGYGYIRLTALAHLDNIAQSPEDIWNRFQAAVSDFKNAGVPAIVLDLRGNHGGYDQLAAAICGIFTAVPTVYEVIEMFDSRSGQFINLSTNFETGELANASMITPQAPQYAGPVVALVNPRTISSGEGLARCINDKPNGAVLGFHGTRGSFAAAGGEILMPGGIALHYPYGRAVDAQGVVQIDSRNGVGGVLPKLRIPKSFTNVMAYARGEDPEYRAAISYLDQLLKGRTP